MMWFNGLQVLRAILFIIVFISHSGAFFPVSGLLGSFGVCSFFILSGFFSSYKEINTDSSIKYLFCLSIHNIWVQIKKFYPLYFIFLLFSLPFNYSSIKNFLACLFLVQSYFLSAETALSYNWPTWFLSSIMFCYFVSPFVRCFLGRIKTCRKTLIFLIVLLYTIMLAWAYWWKSEPEPYGRGYYFVYIFPIARSFDFIAGCLLGLLFQSFCQSNNHDNNSYFMYSSFEYSAIILLIIQIVFITNISSIYVYTAFFFPISCALTWLFAREKGFITKCLSRSKALLWMGALSYELYIVHRLILAFFGVYNNSFLSWIYATITTLLTAQMFAITMDFLKKHSFNAKKADK